MRKREFVGVGAIIGIISTLVGIILYRKGYIKGYAEADKTFEV